MDRYFNTEGLCEPELLDCSEEEVGGDPVYAVDCGAAGDFLFVIPYEDLYGDGKL